LRYTDPSGHCSTEGDDWCHTPAPTKKKPTPIVPPKKSGNLDSDKLGRAILNRYLTNGGDWFITSDQEWANYMADNPTLKEDLNARSVKNAKFMLDNGYSSILIDERYPMEIENGEAIIAYQYLHGTDNTVGDFHRLGTATMSKTSNGGHNVTFSLAYTWNDIIDPNLKYKTDKDKSSFAKIITLGMATPYNIHITWTQTTIVHLNSNGNATTVTNVTP
jgi:hypothetical protein